MEKASLKKNKIVCINTYPPTPQASMDKIRGMDIYRYNFAALQNLYLSDALTTMTRCYWILTEKNTFLNQSVTGDGIGC